MFERIVLSVDGSEDSDKAVRTTGELARQNGSNVLVVHGRDLALMGPPVPSAPVPPRQLDLETEEEAQRLVDDAVSQLREQGVDVKGMVLPNQGRLAQQIVEAAEADHATAIVLGSRGMSRLHELMIGSVADKVIRLSKVPVLLVR